MRTSAIVAAGLLALTVFASCKKEKKEKVDTTKPAINWEANANFAQQEITVNMDAVVSFSAPQGISAFTLKFTKLPEDLRGVVKQHIGNNANRTGVNSDSPVMDPVDDATVSSYFAGLGLPSGASIQGSTSVSFDFKCLLDDLLLNQVLDNNSVISILLTLVDKDERSITKTVSFHYTSGPEIKWAANPDFSLVEIAADGKANASLKLAVPGKIASVTITVNTPSTTLYNALKAYISASSAKELVVYLIGDADAVRNFANFGMATGSSLEGKTDVTLDMSKFVDTIVKPLGLSDAPNVEHSFRIKVVDSFGKEAGASLVFAFVPAA